MRDHASPPTLLRPARGGGPSRTGSALTPPARHDRSGPARPVAGDVAATLALVVATLAAVASFDRVFSGGRWAGPVVATALGVHAVCWAARRRGLHPYLAAPVGLAAVGLAAVWTVLPSSTTLGLPLGASWHAVGAALTQAGNDFPASVAPVTASPGFVLLAVAGAGLVALLGDWAAFRIGAPVLAALPAVALFVVCGVVGTSRGRPWAVGIVVAAVASFVLVHRSSFARGGEAWLGGRSAGGAAWMVGAGSAATAMAVVAALVATPSLPRSDGHGVLGWRGTGPGSGGSDRSVPSPIVDLSTRLLHLRTTAVFTVRSPVPSYWRLTSLDTFNGVQWQSTNSYVGVSRQLPGVQPAPPGTRTVPEEFHIQSLSSIWMPTAFSPEAISGGGQVSWDATSGSLLAARATSDGLDYQLTSRQYLQTVTAARLAATPAVAASSFTRRYTQLPSSVPGDVYALARTITAGTRTEYAAALALQDYFIDNPAFSYSLQPPSDGYGTGALTTFLFDTRVGYCQQFAGAYAVLARAVGLPTRLAVGFAIGTPIGDDTYQVRDADAHTWPEVYFGSSIGWLPFEPTKGGDFAIPGAAAYTGDTAGGAPSAAATTPTTVAPAPAPVPAARPVGATTHTTGGGATPAVHHGSSNLPLVLAAVALLAAAVAWLLGNLVARRARWWRRRRRASHAGDDAGSAQVLVAWAEISELLAWWRIRRRAEETPSEFAARAARELRSALGADPALLSLEALAAAATAADYGHAGIAASDVEAAVREALAVRLLLSQSAAPSRHFELLVDPRLAWRRAPVEAATGMASLGGPS